MPFCGSLGLQWAVYSYQGVGTASWHCPQTEQDPGSLDGSTFGIDLTA